MIPPEPDPPTPVTYNFTGDITYGLQSDSGIDYTLVLSYKEQAESEWVQIDSAVLTSQYQGGTSTVLLRNIPQGCHSIKIAISSAVTNYLYIKTSAETTWGTEITYGSGNEGWNQDYQSNIDVIVRDD